MSDSGEGGKSMFGINNKAHWLATRKKYKYITVAPLSFFRNPGY